MKLAIETKYFTMMQTLSIIVSSLLTYVIWVFISNSLNTTLIYGTVETLLSSHYFYTTTILNVGSIFIVELAVKSLE